MSLQPLLNASPAIQVHAVLALLAFVLGVVQLVMPKGTVAHRLLGWTWVSGMLIVAGSSLFIHEARLIGPFSPIHLLSVQVLVALPIAVLHARRGRIASHAKMMKMMFLGAMVIAGALTVLPGRIINQVLFGG